MHRAERTEIILKWLGEGETAAVDLREIWVKARRKTHREPFSLSAILHLHQCNRWGNVPLKRKKWIREKKKKNEKRRKSSNVKRHESMKQECVFFHVFLFDHLFCLSPTQRVTAFTFPSLVPCHPSLTQTLPFPAFLARSPLLHTLHAIISQVILLFTRCHFCSKPKTGSTLIEAINNSD